jgi:hypothetical protein
MRYLLFLITVIGFYSCDPATGTGKYTADSTTSPEVKAATSIVTIDSVTIQRLMPLTKIKKDEFKNTKWVELKEAPKYRNQNGIYCYFNKDEDVASNFRFVIQYAADDWIFFKSCNFVIDGKPFGRPFIPDNVETDNGEGGIWEWSDDKIDQNYVDLIEALATAKTAKIRFEGRQYYQNKTITTKQLSGIKTMYTLYKALGGIFE